MAYYNQAGQYQAGYQQGHGQPVQHGQYYQQQYQHYQQPSQQYGDYGNYFQQSVFSTNAWQAFQFQTPNELQQVFQMELQKNPANGRRHAIQAEDLCNIMNNCHTIRNFFRCHEGYIHWSRELCSIMLSMLDRSGDGFMQWNEFQELQQCLVQWYQMFKQFDYDGSGYIEANELVNIVRTQFKYNLTPQSIETLLKRYSRVIMWGGQEKCLIAFDDFVSVSVRLRAYTDAFRKRDQLQNGGDSGTCTFAYDDFIRCVMCL